MRGGRRHSRAWRRLVTAGFLALLGSFSTEVCVAGEIAVIVNAEIDLADLPLGKLRRIYEGKQKNLQGKKRVYALLIPPEKTAERSAVLTTIYEKGEQSFFQYWQGETGARKPKKFSRPQDALEEVGRNSKAVAVVGTRCPNQAGPFEIDRTEPCESKVRLFEIGGHLVALAGVQCPARGEVPARTEVLEADDLLQLRPAVGKLPVKPALPFRSEVKILKIDGIEPCGRGYPLRSVTARGSR